MTIFWWILLITLDNIIFGVKFLEFYNLRLTFTFKLYFQLKFIKVFWILMRFILILWWFEYKWRILIIIIIWSFLYWTYNADIVIFDRAYFDVNFLTLPFWRCIYYKTFFFWFILNNFLISICYKSNISFWSFYLALILHFWISFNLY